MLGKLAHIQFFHDSFQVFLMIVSLTVNVIVWGVLFYFIGFGTETVVFHYNAYFGVDLTARARYLTLFPASGLLFFFANTSLAFEFFRKDEKAAALAVSALTFFLQIAVLVVVVALILVNT